jgi:hypothetical protein
MDDFYGIGIRPQLAGEMKVAVFVDSIRGSCEPEVVQSVGRSGGSVGRSGGRVGGRTDFLPSSLQHKSAWHMAVSSILDARVRSERAHSLIARPLLLHCRPAFMLLQQPRRSPY